MNPLSTATVRVGYLGPEGTFSHAAALAGAAAVSHAESAEMSLVPLATIHDVVMAVADGRVHRAVVPLENSIEGSVSVTLDTLAIDAGCVHITGERIQTIEQCLIAGAPIALDAVRTVLSHPQASAQCARFLHDHMGQADVVSASSTADAVREVIERGPGWAALGPRLAAERYGGVLLAEGVEDAAANRTRFVWLVRAGADGTAPAPFPGHSEQPGDPAIWKTSLVFWGDGSQQPGWLVHCLSELGNRGVNMSRIESRPRKQELGEYMFFVDCQGSTAEPVLAEALAALTTHTQVLRVLGSYPVTESATMRR